MKHSINKILLSLMVVLLLPLSSLGVEYVRGDINGDRTVNVGDVTALISQVLSSGSAYIPRSDVNYDRATNIADVTELIHYILAGDWLSPYPYPSYPENAQVFTVNGVSFAMIPVEGGTFDFVSYGHYPTTREVTLGDFMIGQTEVTQGLWMAVMGENPSIYNSNNMEQPVDNVMYFDCEDFIAKLNELTGMDFCFPTDEQWQFAARGGNQSHGYQYSGSDDPVMVAWYLDGNDLNSPSPVGLKLPNELGLYDMSGNVRERVYCADSHHGYNVNYLLGGGTHDEREKCTVYSSYGTYPGYAPPVAGLRLALPVTSTATAR